MALAGKTEFFVADWGARNKGTLFHHESSDAGERSIKTAPQCYKGVLPGPYIDLVVIAAKKGKAKRADAIQVIGKHRECQSWIKYQSGRDLNQHYEDWRAMEIEALRQRQSEIELKVMEDHKLITERLTTITSNQVDFSDRQERSNRRFNRLFLAIGFIAIVLALAPLAYPDGIDWVVDSAPGAINPASVPATDNTPTLTLTPTPTPESTPDTALPQPQSTP